MTVLRDREAGCLLKGLLLRENKTGLSASLVAGVQANDCFLPPGKTRWIDSAPRRRFSACFLPVSASTGRCKKDRLRACRISIAKRGICFLSTFPVPHASTCDSETERPRRASDGSDGTLRAVRVRCIRLVAATSAARYRTRRSRPGR